MPPVPILSPFIVIKIFQRLAELNNGRESFLDSQDAQNVCPARPQRVKGRGVPGGYVEGLNDARTTLADFFSIRL